MLEPYTVVLAESRETAVIPIRVPREKIQEAMDPAIIEVLQAVQKQGIGPAGPLFTYHLNIEPDYFNFEVGFPVNGEVQPVGRVKASRLPGVWVARTVYVGPYEGLGEAWGRFMEELENSGLTLGSDLWESYLTSPQGTPDPANYRTELNRPVLK